MSKNKDEQFAMERPQIHYFDSVPTTMEIAARMAHDGKLGIWDSVAAREQTEGRGQLRRRWYSPAGNIYASIRLPTSAPFNSTAASIATGALCAMAMADLHCPAKLKWPNDLVLPDGNELAKVGGILLEEHDGILIGGIGINIDGAPSNVRGPWTLPATSLQAACHGNWPESRELWPMLVNAMLKVYKDASFFASHWLKMAESVLVFTGHDVEVQDGEEIIAGTLRGIAKDGCALLATPKGEIQVCSGSMRLA